MLFSQRNLQILLLIIPNINFVKPGLFENDVHKSDMLTVVVANPLKIQHKILFASCLYKCLLTMVVANPQKCIKFYLHLAYINVYRSKSIILYILFSSVDLSHFIVF